MLKQIIPSKVMVRLRGLAFLTMCIFGTGQVDAVERLMNGIADREGVFEEKWY